MANTKSRRLSNESRQAVQAAARVGLYLLIEQRTWTIFDKTSGQTLLTYYPTTGYWSENHERVYGSYEAALEEAMRRKSR
jgi:hypothetical protein